MNNRFIIAIVYMILSGLAFPIIRYVSLYFHVLNNNAVRLLSAGIVFILIALWKFRQQVKYVLKNPETMFNLLIIAVVMFFNIYLSTEGLKYTTALTGSIFGIIMMPVAMIMAAVFYKDEREHLKSSRFYQGSFIALIGSFAFVLGNDSRGESTDLVKGTLLLTGWIIVQPIQNLIVKKVAKNIHSIVISASTATLSGLIYFAVAGRTGVIYQLSEVGSLMLVILILAGIYCLMTGMFLAFYIVQKQGLVFFNILQLLVPVSTAVIGFIMLGETVSFSQVIAMIFVMAGCFIALKK